MSTKSTTQSKLLTRLCRDLSEANTVLVSKGDTPRHSGTRAIAREIENMILRLLTEEDLRNDRLRAGMVASGSRKLITRLHESNAPLAVLEGADWGRFLSAATPDTVRFALQRRVSTSGITVPLLGRLTGGDHQWFELFYDMAQKQSDPKMLTPRHRRLLHAPKARPFVEGYLIKQAQHFPGQYCEVAQNYIGQGDLVVFTLIHLAGIPIDNILRGYHSPGGFGQRLMTHLGSSNHQRLSFYGRAASLEAVLTDPSPILELQRTLSRPKAA